MRTFGLVLFASVAVASCAFGGTFTTADTLISVPASAAGTGSGDTSPVTSNTIHLDARVYIPDGLTAPAPVVVIIHGYGASKSSGTVVTVAEDFASNGYVVLTPTARGFGDSDGLVSLAGPNEINDLKTIIVAMQTGVIGDSPAVSIPVNGGSKFGVTGASYGGGHAYEIMRTHVAGLTAVAPVIGWTDLYQSLAPNDVTKLSFGLALFGGGFDLQNPNYDDAMFGNARDLLSGNPENIRNGGPQNNIDWRSVIFDPAELSVPVFAVQGWQDWLFPAEQATSLFQGSTSIPFFKLYVGGIGHPPANSAVDTPEAVYIRTQLLRWFDYWLKGVDTGITTEPRVTIAPERTAVWAEASLVKANTFPLPGTTATNFFINNNNLSNAAPTKGKVVILGPTSSVPAVLKPLSDAIGGTATALIQAIIVANNAINSGGDLFSPSLDVGLDTGANAQTFVSKPLTANLRVVGRPDFHFFVSGGAANAHYYAEIIERTSSGDRLVSRAAFKDHTSAFSSIHEIDFSGFGMNRLFNAGNRIGLRIASRDFPFFLINPSQPTLRFYRASGRASHMTLPVVP